MLIGIYNGKLANKKEYSSLVGLNIFKRSGEKNEDFRESKV